MIKEKLTARFCDLLAQSENINSHSSGDASNREVVDNQDWQKWATSALNLIGAACGESSVHYRNFVSAMDKCSGWTYEVRAMFGVFHAAKEDYEGGYVFNIEMSVSGEILGSMVLLAKQAATEGYKDSAAVLASAALEDSLKRLAAKHGLSVADKTMDQVINALKSKGVVTGVQKAILDTMPKYRNSAMHAEWDKISIHDAMTMISFVETFLGNHFGTE